MPHDWLHTVIEIVGLALTVYVITARNKRDAKRDNERREQETEKRHKENKDKLDYLVLERTFLTPHYHQEIGGPLHAEGIIRKINGGLPRG